MIILDNPHLKVDRIKIVTIQLLIHDSLALSVSSLWWLGC